MWTADSTQIFADGGVGGVAGQQWTADGFLPVAPTPPPPTGGPFDYTDLITSEHASKPKFTALVDAIANGMGDIRTFVQGIPAQFDLDTAVAPQLDVVGQWVGQGRVIPNVLLTGFFGFEDDEAALPFGELGQPSIGGVFYELGAPYGGTTILDDDTYRTVLRAKITTNQSDGTAAALTQAVQDIFGVSATIQDLGNLSITITVASLLTQLEQALIRQFSLLPLPAGVGVAAINYSGFVFAGDMVDTTQASGQLSTGIKLAGAASDTSTATGHL